MKAIVFRIALTNGSESRTYEEAGPPTFPATKAETVFYSQTLASICGVVTRTCSLGVVGMAVRKVSGKNKGNI